jgi:predicted metal-dependent hydrolase
VRTAGRFHDLAEIAARVNREYFGDRLDLVVTWGRARTGRRVRQRQLGSFDRERNLVTISPVLDQEEVPGFFVAYVVFHEMLHSVQSPDSGSDHDAEFRAVERMYPDFRRAEAWQRRNMGLLMNPGGRRRRRRKKRAPAATERDLQGLLF